MRIPRKIKVGVFSYTVKRPEMLNVNQCEARGAIEHKEHTIHVQGSLTVIEAQQTLFHELMHAAECLAHLTVPEDTTSRLSDALFEILYENGLLAD